MWRSCCCPATSRHPLTPLCPPRAAKRGRAEDRRGSASAIVGQRRGGDDPVHEQLVCGAADVAVPSLVPGAPALELARPQPGAAHPDLARQIIDEGQPNTSATIAALRRRFGAEARPLEAPAPSPLPTPTRLQGDALRRCRRFAPQPGRAIVCDARLVTGGRRPRPGSEVARHRSPARSGMTCREQKGRGEQAK